jgi:hypothetical protein
MLRQGDGMAGVVEDIGGEPRIVYVDRGERLVSAKSQKWVPANPFVSRLRQEEMLEVALVADRALRAIDLHEPRRYWEPVRTIDEPHDPKLVRVIVEHLSSRA